MRTKLSALFSVFLGLSLASLQPTLAATHIWQSSTGDFADPRSWSTGVPPSGWLPNDVVLFTSPVTQSVTTNLDASSIHVRSINVTREYFGNIGTNSTPLRIQADQIVFRGSGSLFFIASPAPMTFCMIDSINRVDAAVIAGGPGLRIFVKSGGVSVGPVAELAQLVSLGIDSFVEVFADSGAASISQLFVAGGHVINGRQAFRDDLIVVSWGVLEQTGTIHDAATVIVTNGQFQYTPSKPQIGIGPYMNLVDGTVDFSRSNQTIGVRLGFVGPRAFPVGSPFQSIADMGLVDLFPGNPNWSIVNRGDSDDDGILDIFDMCPSNANGVLSDTNADCVVDLRDFATLQNELNGP